MFSEFRIINGLRQKWISNRKYPDYNSLEESDILPNINSVNSRELSEVFKPYPKLSRFLSDQVLEGALLNELRTSIKYLLKDRFEILEKIVKMRDSYSKIIKDLQDDDFQKNLVIYVVVNKLIFQLDH